MPGPMGEAFDYVSVEMWLRALLAGRFHDVVFTNAEGVVRLASLAGRLGVLGDLRLVLREVRKITMGFEPTSALAKLSLESDLVMMMGVDCESLDTLGGFAQRRVGLLVGCKQLDRKLLSVLEGRGAQVHLVAFPRSVAARQR